MWGLWLKRAAIGEAGPELTLLLPKLRRILPALPNSPELLREQSRRQLFNAFCNFISCRCRKQPILLILEDLHWADESTLSLMSHLSQRYLDLPLMMIATYRSSDSDLGSSLAAALEGLIRSRRAIQINLEGLMNDDVALMLKSLANHTPPAAVAHEFFAETAGNPFFVEELFRHLEDENRIYDEAGEFNPKLKVEEEDVPRNVRLVVGRRLARLGEARTKLLTVAAVIGRSFTFELLEASSDVKRDALLDALDEASRSGLIRSAVEYTTARFEFSHELIRQVALSQVSTARHQRMHLDVADAIERIYSGTLEDHFATLAYHYNRGDNGAKAVDYLERAGHQALQRYAYGDAIVHFSSAIKLLQRLPEGTERIQRELVLQWALSPAIVAVEGQASSRTEHVFMRARELYDQLKLSPGPFGPLFGLFLVYVVRAELLRAYAIAQELFGLAQITHDPMLLMYARYALGMTLYHMGKFASAREHFEIALTLYDHDLHPSLPLKVTAPILKFLA